MEGTLSKRPLSLSLSPAVVFLRGERGLYKKKTLNVVNKSDLENKK